MIYFAYGLAALYGTTILVAILVNGFEQLRSRFAKEQRLLTSEDADLVSEPEIIITLVHGTWSKAASWVKPHSLLRSSLSAALDNPPAFHCFPWSGRNSIRARRKSAVLLRQRLRELTARHPRAQHFLIGHSHGGSIILDSLDAEIARKMRGIVCLATPVLIARRRQFDPVARVALAFIPVVPMVGFGQWIIERNGLEGSDIESFIGLLFICAGFFVSWIIYQWAKKLPTGNDLSFLDRDKIIFLRALGDEASALLSAAHLVSWMVGKISTWPTRVLSHAQQRVERWRQKLVRRWHIIVLIFGLGIAGAIISLGLDQYVWFGLSLLTIAIPASLIAILLQGGGMAQITAYMFSAMLLIPMVLVLGIVGLTIGPEMAI